MHHLPARFCDLLPEASPPIPPDTHPSFVPHVILHVFDSFRTAFNAFGIARDYQHQPSHDPNIFLSLEELSNTKSNLTANEPPPAGPYPPPWPWKTMSVWRLMSWMKSGSRQKSMDEVTWLARTILMAEDFCPADLLEFNAYMEMKQFDVSEKEHDADHPFRKDGWIEVLLTISIPTCEQNLISNGRPFTILSFFHRKLTAVMEAAFSDRTAKWFHMMPFRWIWRSTLSGQEQRIYDELYTSDAWNQAHDEVQKQRHSEGCKLERAIAGMMFSSDATHLAQFGHISAWLIYLSFGNLSKYVRARPNTPGTSHLVGFIPKVCLDFISILCRLLMCHIGSFRAPSSSLHPSSPTSRIALIS